MNAPSKPSSLKKWVKPAVASMALVGLFFAAKTYLERTVTVDAPKSGVVVMNPDGTRTLVGGTPKKMGKELIYKDDTSTYRFWKMSDGSVSGTVYQKNGAEPEKEYCTYMIGKDGIFTATLSNPYFGTNTYQVTTSPTGKVSVTIKDPTISPHLGGTYVPDNLRSSLPRIAGIAQQYGMQ